MQQSDFYYTVDFPDILTEQWVKDHVREVFVDDEEALRGLRVKDDYPNLSRAVEYVKSIQSRDGRSFYRRRRMMTKQTTTRRCEEAPPGPTRPTKRISNSREDEGDGDSRDGDEDDFFGYELRVEVTSKNNAEYQDGSVVVIALRSVKR